MYLSCGRDTNHWGPEGRLWWTDSRVALTFPTSCVRFLLSVNGTCEMLLIGRIWQRQLDMCDYVHMIILHKTAICLARRPPLLCRLWRSKLPCHELPYQQGAEGSLQLMSARKYGPQSTTCKKLNTPTAVWAWRHIWPQSNFWSPQAGKQKRKVTSRLVSHEHEPEFHKDRLKLIFVLVVFELVDKGVLQKLESFIMGLNTYTWPRSQTNWKWIQGRRVTASPDAASHQWGE